MTNRPTEFRTFLLRGAAVVALLGGGLAAGVSVQNARAADPAVTTAPRAVADFTDLVSRVKPAVVSITTKMKAAPAADTDDSGQMPFGMPGMQKKAPARGGQARGSGFIVNANGIIVTNNHVVQDATSVMVTLDDGTELPARIIGRDARTDIAVLKIKAPQPLPHVDLGNSAQVRPGEWVVAMGNPFGLGGTVTAGIVSARGRDIGAGPYDDFIQIDAPINHGNSGGPLFNQDGTVIGVNSAILSPSGGSVGIGFAIPADLVRSVVADLQNGGKVTRGYFGLETQPVTAEMASALNLPSDAKTKPAGALVTGVEPESPAAKAGVQPGDVIRTVAGQKIETPRSLAVEVAKIAPGTASKMELVRDGSLKTIDITVGTQPGDMADKGGAQAEPGKVGVALAQLTPELRQQLSVPEKLNGAVIAQVAPGSPAEAAGLQQGDVIVGVGSKAVASADDAVKAIKATTLSGKNVALRVYRDGRTAFVAVAIGPKVTAPNGDEAPQEG